MMVDEIVFPVILARDKQMEYNTHAYNVGASDAEFSLIRRSCTAADKGVEKVFCFVNRFTAFWNSGFLLKKCRVTKRVWRI